MDHTELELNSFNDFLAWKAEIENNTKSKFISYSTKHINIHGVKYYYFRCHRSGNFMSESKGLRHLKTLGSNKINAYCPAALKVTEHTDGKCIVSYQKVHVGHQNDLGHLFLTADERKNIASKIAAKIPLDNILDEIRNVISDAGLERVHLLTKKDLHNIEISFNLASNSVKHENDRVSVDMWVREMQNSENPCILFYKTQGSTCTQYSFLKENDFVLIIMTEAQGEILKKFSSDCICIDGTHGVNGYGFELVTLLTIDDLRQGFPCAFLISNRCDQPVLSIFFSCIKQKIGQLQPQIFMSDIAESFFNAWKSEMGVPQKRLFCAWHIDRAWRKNLKKIKGAEKQAKTYKIIRSLLEERDIYTFQTLTEAAIKFLKGDPDTIEFSNYFETYYLQNISSWAYCYRLHSGINTNMHIERMHRTSKYIYLHGKNVKRLDKAIHGIMRFVRDKMIDRLITSNKGKLTSKIRDLRIRHKTSETLSLLVMENENGWILKSIPPQLEAADISNAQEIHFPTTNKDIPPNKNIIPQRFSNAKKKRKLTKTSTVTSQNDNNTILNIILEHKNFTHSPTEES
ncbi:uncharacterized protein NPIL_110731 [Nephila pilipes]|uniref:MULE transposase domain-containing protein n=1 Tax=Nephila pilipes TaxID=299642 RepID=A0A8X6UAY9_NEPPI|nr:uncharacterized protein NPIL_110731 [Nephila pilipes]